MGEIKARRRLLDEVASEVARRVKEGYIGLVLPVLCESADDNRMTGYTPNYLRAEFTAERVVGSGEEISVRFTDLRKDRLIGEA